MTILVYNEQWHVRELRRDPDNQSGRVTSFALPLRLATRELVRRSTQAVHVEDGNRKGSKQVSTYVIGRRLPEGSPWAGLTRYVTVSKGRCGVVLQRCDGDESKKYDKPAVAAELLDLLLYRALVNSASGTSTLDGAWGWYTYRTSLHRQPHSRAVITYRSSHQNQAHVPRLRLILPYLRCGRLDHCAKQRSDTQPRAPDEPKRTCVARID